MKLILFTAPWCGQCKAYHPIISKFIKNFPQIEFEEINVEENEDAVNKYNIKNLPTTIVMDHEVEVGRSTGILNNNQLKYLLQL